MAAGVTSITMEGTSVTHMYKPGIFSRMKVPQYILHFYLYVGGCTLGEKQVKKLIQQSELKTKEVVRLIEMACSPVGER